MNQLPVLMLLATAVCLVGCGRSEADVAAKQQKEAFEENKKLTNFQFIPLTPPAASAPAVKSPFGGRQAPQTTSAAKKDGDDSPISK